jgi:hypothetical protein
MKPNNKESRIKYFLRVQRRINELHTLIRNAPDIKLKKPIFVGHWRFFKVRDDVLRSSLGQQVKLVVDACNQWVLGKKDDPKSYENRCYTRVYCSYLGSTAVSKQHLYPLSQAELDKCNFPNPIQFIRRWFDIEEKTKSFGSKNIITRTYYPKVRPHMLEFAYKRAYITEEHCKVGDYESELAKLYQFMNDNHGWDVVYSHNNKDEWDNNLTKKKIIRHLNAKELREEYI